MATRRGHFREIPAYLRECCFSRIREIRPPLRDAQTQGAARTKYRTFMDALGPSRATLIAFEITPRCSGWLCNCLKSTPADLVRDTGDPALNGAQLSLARELSGEFISAFDSNRSPLENHSRDFINFVGAICATRANRNDVINVCEHTALVQLNCI